MKSTETKKNVNRLLPAAASVQISPFYKSTLMEITADTSDKSGDIFSVGKMKVGENEKGNSIFVEGYALAKPLLMKLATAAGIQFHPDFTTATKINANTFVGKAYGAVRLPDGTYKTHCDSKTICLDDEEVRMRLEYIDKSHLGISGWSAAQAAAKIYSGEWVETGKTNDKGYPEKIFLINEKDRERYIERSMLVAMAQLRKTASEKAQTGAILRVIRALLGIKGVYTMEELKNPFVLPSVSFSPDYNDPTVRNALLQQGMQAMSGLFGPSVSALPMGNSPFGQMPEPTFDDVVDNPVIDPEDLAQAAEVQEPVPTTPKPAEKPKKADVKKPETPKPAEKPTAAASKETEIAPTASIPAQEQKETEPVMTAATAKAFVVPEGYAYQGMSLKQVANQPGGMDVIREMANESLSAPKLAEAAAVIVAIVEENKRKAEKKAS